MLGDSLRLICSTVACGSETDLFIGKYDSGKKQQMDYFGTVKSVKVLLFDKRKKREE